MVRSGRFGERRRSAEAQARPSAGRRLAGGSRRDRLVGNAAAEARHLAGRSCAPRPRRRARPLRGRDPAPRRALAPDPPAGRPRPGARRDAPADARRLHGEQHAAGPRRRPDARRAAPRTAQVGARLGRRGAPARRRCARPDLRPRGGRARRRARACAVRRRSGRAGRRRRRPLRKAARARACPRMGTPDRGLDARARQRAWRGSAAALRRALARRGLGLPRCGRRRSASSWVRRARST